MRPIKPKKMPKALGEWLKDVCEGRCAPQDFETSDARAILAALEYERQRADKAERAALPDSVEMRPVVSPDVQRAETAAVVPAKRTRIRCLACKRLFEGTHAHYCSACRENP